MQAKKAKINDYKVVEYPEKIDRIKALLTNAKENISIYYTKKELGENYLIYKKMQNAIQNSGIQARMDYEIKIK